MNKVYILWATISVTLALIAKVTFEPHIEDTLTFKQWVSFLSATFCVLILALPIIYAWLMFLIKNFIKLR